MNHKMRDNSEKCPNCGQHVNSKNLARHLRKVHSSKKNLGNSKCPQCKLTVKKDRGLLSLHFIEVHNRQPTAGEITQFMNYKDTEVPYADGDFVKPFNEVPGGGVSPR